MTLTAWRIYKPKHAATAFTGEGARLFGGRLNTKGTAVVYAAASISLAAMALLVHLQSSEVLAKYVLRGASFDEALVKRLTRKDLPKTWKQSPPPVEVRRIGDEWVAAGESAVLQVPSVVVEAECNYLFNPHHADFRHVRIGPQRRFGFDPRLLKA